MSNVKNALKPLKSAISVKNTNKLSEAQIKQVVDAGIQKSTASNGTPMNKLHGAAHATATLSNIGGGSVATGGGGMKQGVKLLGILYGMNINKNSK